MNLISAKVVADSINEFGNRITTLEVVFPRYILAEFNTHRMFSRNSASSRAIPFKKMLRTVRDTLFTPMAWQKDHSGMQGTEYFEGRKAIINNFLWKVASRLAITAAWTLHKFGVTKQLANRILEPFLYHKVLVTATEFENFFDLRSPQYRDLGDKSYSSFMSRKMMVKKWKNRGLPADKLPALEDDLGWLKLNKGMGEIHIMDLAEKMWDAMDASIPKELKAGEWHIPYGDNLFSNDDFYEFFRENTEIGWLTAEGHDEALTEMALKISVARSARLSYQTLGDNPVIDYAKDLKLFDTLASSKHYSPFEHVGRAMTNEEYGVGKIVEEDSKKGWSNNFKGFVQYRQILEKRLK